MGADYSTRKLALVEMDGYMELHNILGNSNFNLVKMLNYDHHAATQYESVRGASKEVFFMPMHLVYDHSSPYMVVFSSGISWIAKLISSRDSWEAFTKKTVKKRKLLAHISDVYYTPKGDVFHAIMVMLPSTDKDEKPVTVKIINPLMLPALQLEERRKFPWIKEPTDASKESNDTKRIELMDSTASDETDE